MNDLQKVYNKLIKTANISYIQSKEEIFAGLHRELNAKAEAFESAADCLLSAFPNEITRVETMRWEDIRTHHLSEVDESLKTPIENDFILEGEN